MLANVGDIASVLIQSRQALEEAYDDLARFNAPSECGNDIERGNEEDLQATLKERFCITVREAVKLVERATSYRWVYFNL